MRPGWDEYYMELAQIASKRATCDRLHVGCIFVRDHDVIATGYNGSIAGHPHCDTLGHDMYEGHCVRTIHAEQNGVCMAARNGHSLKGATLYVTHFPCWLCFRLLLQTGVQEVIYGTVYRKNPRVEEAAKHSGIVLRQWTSLQTKANPI